MSIRRYVRRNIRDTLYHDDIVETSLYDVFVGPFEDVLHALPLTIATITSVARLNLTVLFAIDPGKIAAAHGEFDKRQGEISKKWEPIMKNNQIAAAQGDLGAVAFALAPAAFLGGAAMKGLYNNAGNIGGWARDAGLDKGLLSMLPGFSAGKSKYPETPGGAANDSKKKGTVRNVLEKLASIFFIYTPTESQFRDDLPLIVEKIQKPAPFEQALAQWLDDTGLSNEFEEMKKETAEIQIGKAKASHKIFADKLIKFAGLFQATDLEQIVAAIKEISPEQASKVESIDQNLKKAEDELAKNEKFIQQLKDEKKTNPKEEIEMSEDEIRSSAKKVAFAQAKVDLQKQLEDMLKDKKSMDDLIMQATDAIFSDFPIKNEKAMTALRKDSFAASVVKELQILVDDIKSQIQKLQSMSF